MRTYWTASAVWTRTQLDGWLIQDRHLEMIKAAIPYLDNSRQKNMAMLVKFMEFQRTMALFQNPEIS